LQKYVDVLMPSRLVPPCYSQCHKASPRALATGANAQVRVHAAHC